MSQPLLLIDACGSLIELTREYLSVRLKPEAIEGLKRLTEGNGVLHPALSNLLLWAHHLFIPVLDIVDAHIEVDPTPPGGFEIARAVIKSRHHGGYMVHEVCLGPEDAQKLVSEISKIVNLGF